MKTTEGNTATIGDRILSVREQKGMTQKVLADLVGISRTALLAWEKGVSVPHAANLYRLATVLSVSPDWLQTGAQHEGGTMLGGMALWDSATPLGDDDAELPLYKETSLAAGDGRCAEPDYSGRKLRFSRNTLRSKGVSPENAACVSVTGNSMEPVIPDGSVVGVDTAERLIRDGKMYAIDHDGYLRIKILYRIPDGMRVTSFNKDEHPDEIYTGEAAQKISIIGRVFWYSVLL